MAGKKLKQIGVIESRRRIEVTKRHKLFECNLFKSLKMAMGTDADRAVKCLEKDLDSLVVYYRFEKRFWIALKTTNPIERINKEFKKRSRSLGTMGEQTLECLLAFTALRLEMNWKKVPVDSVQLANLKSMREKENVIEKAVVELLH